MVKDSASIPEKKHWDLVLFTDMSRPLQGRPLGAYCIASHLRKQGYRVKVIWAWNRMDPRFTDMIIKEHVRPGTKAVGVSTTLTFSTDANGEHRFFGIDDEEVRRRFRLFKEINPNIKILIGGGNVVYADPAFLKSFKEVDYYVKGQAETAITAIMSSICGGIKFNANDLVKPPIVSDSFYPFENFNSSVNLFAPEDGILPGEPLSLEIARGCIFKCSFCSYDLLNKDPMDYMKTVDNLVKEFKNNYDLFGTTSYVITDDIINESDYKVDLLSKAAESLPFDLNFVGYLRLDLVRKFPQRMKRLKDLGIYAGFFGIETVNDASGKAVGKGLGLKRIQEGLEVVVDLYGDRFYGEAGIIMGLPHDDPDTKYRVIEWLDDPLTARVIHQAALQPMSINTKFGQSEIDRDPAKFGYEITGRTEARRFQSVDSWKTKSYDSSKAIDDVQWIHKKFAESRPLSKIVNIWNLPYFIWLDDRNNQDSVLDIVMHKSNKESQESWRGRMEDLYRAKRKEYIIGMAKYR